MPNRLTQADKPPGMYSNTDLSRLGSILPIRRGVCNISHHNRAGDKLRILRCGAISIKLTAKGVMG